MDEFEKMFLNLMNKMFEALNGGSLGVRISVSPDGNVYVDPIRPRKRKIYVPFEVVDAGNQYIVTLDIRHLPRRATTLRVVPTGVFVETPRGERFIYFDDSVRPETTTMEEREGIVELTVQKGKGEGEKVIKFPE